MTTGETLGQRVRRLREKKGLSQDRLAKLADISAGAIYLIETGRRKRFQEWTLEAVAKALDVSPDYLSHGMELDGSIPSFDVVLRQTSTLTEEEIQAVKNYVEFLEYRQLQEMEGRGSEGGPETERRGA